MKRLTEKGKFSEPYDCKSATACINKLGRLEDIEEELDVDLIKFLTEFFYVLDHSSTTTGYTTKGKEITTDYGYIDDFVQDLIEVIK